MEIVVQGLEYGAAVGGAIFMAGLALALLFAVVSIIKDWVDYHF